MVMKILTDTLFYTCSKDRDPELYGGVQANMFGRIRDNTSIQKNQNKIVQ